MQSTYEKAIIQVFKDEGGYTNDPHDPGGPTNWGITIHDARQYWKADATAEDVKNMPKSVAEDIYIKHYATPIDYNSLPAGVDYAVFDYAINSGISKSIKTLQGLVGVNTDGIMGPVTLSAVNKSDPGSLIDSIYDKRLAFLQSLKIWPIYGKGWSSRCARGRILALSLVQNTTQEKETQMTTAIAAPSTTNIVLNDLELALSSLNTALPGLLSFVSMFYAPAGAIAKFLPLIQVALTGVETVAQATGNDIATATQAVSDHLTPGQPNAPALNG